MCGALRLELAVDVGVVLGTEGPMNLVCYHSSRNATNFLYSQPMFRLMNWNRQTDCWLERNCNRLDELDLIALMAAVVAAAAVVGAAAG